MNTEQLFCFCCGGEVSADELLKRLKHKFPEYVDDINKEADLWLAEGEATTVCCDFHYGTEEKLREWKAEGLWYRSINDLVQTLYDLVKAAGHVKSMADEERAFLAGISEDAREGDDDELVALSRIATFDRKSLVGAIESYWEREESE